VRKALPRFFFCDVSGEEGTGERRKVEWRGRRWSGGEEEVVSGDGDHGGVVGGEGEGGDVDGPAVTATEFEQGLAEGGIGGDAAGQGDMADGGIAGGEAEFAEEDIDDGGLQGGAVVGEVLRDEIRIIAKPVAEGVEEGGFQSAETVIVGGDVRLAESESVGVALCGEAADVRAAGVRQSEGFGALVESFAGGIVNGLPKDSHAVRRIYTGNLGVSAGNKEAKVRKSGRSMGNTGLPDEVSEDVRLQVIYGYEGAAQGEGQPLGEGCADEEGSHQSGAESDGNGKEVGAADGGLPEGFGNNGEDILLVRTGGQFGDDAAVSAVYVLGGGYVGEEEVVAEDGCRGVVAGRFYAEDYGHRTQRISSR
jgi:hypothetical protein